MYQAECESCGKNWKIPSHRRAYSCKDCGGVVDARPSCASCEARCSPDDSFCQACGHAISDFVQDLNDTRGPSSREDKFDAEAEIDRRLALREFGKHKKTLRALRLYFGFFAVLHGFAAIVGVFGAAAGVVPSWLVFLNFAIFALYVAATLRVMKQPLVWTLGLAAFRTATLALSLAIGEFDFFSIFFTATVWAVVFPAARAEKILRDYPELSDRRARVAGPGTNRGLRRIEKQKRSNRREALVTSGILATVAIVAIFIGALATAGPSLEEKLESFENDWNNGSATAVSEHCDNREDRRFAARLEDALKRRGWTSTRPRLASRNLVQEENRDPLVSYRNDEGDFAFKFELRDEVWYLKSFDLPDVIPTEEIDETLDRFITAWNQESTEDLGRLFSDAEKADSVARRCERWISSLKSEQGSHRILSKSIQERTNGIVRVDFRFQDLGMRTTWEWEYPVWRFRSVSSPR